MGLFGPKEYDPADVRAKKNTPKREKIQRYKPSKRDLANMAKALPKLTGKAAITVPLRLIVDPTTGVIKNMRAVKAVGTYRDRLKEGKCPGCGKGMQRGGAFCLSCARADADTFKSVDDRKDAERALTKALGGQNPLGICYYPDGHPQAGQRVFEHDYDKLAKWQQGNG